MREIGEQWIEEGSDGKRHMYKAVEGESCKGCTFGMMHKGSGLNDIHVCDREDDCPLEYSNTVVKDLGPVNEEGFLREECSGQYPDISHDKRNGVYEAYLHATLINPAMSAVLVRVQASSMDRLKEAWNRRA